MSTDIRAVLDVYPDRSSFTCVGITQKGVRCRNNYFSGSDLFCASRMLDEMNSNKKFSISIKDLEKLAGLTLCPRWHRKPGYSQVRRISLEWQTKIATYEAKLERQKEKAAMIKSERALAEWKKNSVDIKVKLEEEETYEKLPQEQKTTEPLASYYKAQSKMQASSIKDIPKPAQGILTPPASSHNTPSRISTKTTTVKMEPGDSSSQPSPPASPLASKQQASHEIKQEHSPPSTPAKESATPQRQIFTVTKTSSTKVTAKSESKDSVPKTIARKKTKIETFNFEFPPTPDTTPSKQSDIKSTGTKEALKLAYQFGAGKQAPLPTFDLRIATKLPSSIPMAENPLPSFEESKCLKSTHSISAFTFTTEYKPPSKSFDFATPTKLSYAMRLPEKPSTIWDEFNAHADKKDTFSSDLAPNEQSQNAPEPPRTPVKTAPINSSFDPLTPEATPEPLEAQICTEEASYGYAIVTPVSMRYKTYLSSRQQWNGLVTPPEISDPFYAFNSYPSPVAATLRKSLPKLPTQAHDGEVGMCESCAAVDTDCPCGEGYETENIRVGCFSSSRFRRLRKRVVRKVEAVKTRLSGAIHRESGSPKKSH